MEKENEHLRNLLEKEQREKKGTRASRGVILDLQTSNGDTLDANIESP